MKLLPKEKYLGKHHSSILPFELSEQLESNIGALESTSLNQVGFHYSLMFDTDAEWFECILKKLAPNSEYPNGGFIAVISKGRKSIVPMVEIAAILPSLWKSNVAYIQGYYVRSPSDKMDFNF